MIEYAFHKKGFVSITKIFSEELTFEDVSNFFAEVKKNANGDQIPILIDLRYHNIEVEKFDLFFQSESMGNFSAIAIVTPPAVSLTIINYFTKTGRSYSAIQFYDNVKDALEWLTGFSKINEIITSTKPTLSFNNSNEVNVLVYQQSVTLKKQIINSLLQSGFKCEAVESKVGIVQKLHTKKFQFFLCSLYSKDSDMQYILNNIRRSEELKDIRIIANTRTTDKEFIMYLIQSGICGIITEPFTNDFFNKKFQAILNANKINVEKREFLRITPEKGEELKTTFRNPLSHKMISGKVVDLSLGGLLCRFPVLGVDLNLENQVINPIRINLRNTVITPVAKVVRQKENFFSVKILDMELRDKDILSSFIYDAISKDSERKTI